VRNFVLRQFALAGFDILSPGPCRWDHNRHPGAKIPSLPLRSLTIVYHYVAVAIPDGVATTRVDQA